MKDEKYPYNFIVSAAVLSIVFIGYRFAVSDQCIYIPIIRRILDKSIYPGDYLFDQPSGKYTILLPIVAYLSKLFTLRWVFFTGYIAVIFALSWAIYKLAFAFFRNKDMACIALLLLCVSRRQDQAITLQEGFFTIQPVAMPLSLISLYFFIQDRYTLAVAFNALAILIHPISAAPCFLLLAVYLLINSYRLGLKAILRIAGVFFLITSPLLVMAIVSKTGGFHGLSFFRPASKEWMSILYGRNVYAFPALWSRNSWNHLLSIGLLFIVSMFLKIMYSGIDKRDGKAIYIVLASLASLGMAHLFGTIYPISLVFGLQMARGLYMLMYVAFIYAAYVVWSGYQSCKLSLDRGIVAVTSAAAIATGEPNLIVWGAVASVVIWLPIKLPDNIFRRIARAPGILITGFIVYLSLKNSVYAVIICVPIILLIAAELIKKIKATAWKPLYKWVFIYMLFAAVLAAKINKDGLKINFPIRNPSDTWTQVQYWAEANTPKDAVFIVPPNTAGFRNFSRRGIVGDQKDGAPGLFSESYDREWFRRMQQLQSYEKFRDENFTELAEEYRASFIVTIAGHNLGFPKVYENKNYYVYSLQ